MPRGVLASNCWPTMNVASVAASVASARPDQTIRPRRTTVIVSASARTSPSLWEMKMIVRPAAARRRKTAKSSVCLLGSQDAGWLVENQHVGLVVEEADDF